MAVLNVVDISQRELLNNLRKDYLGYLGELLEKYGTTFIYNLKPLSNFLTIDPEIINHILYQNKSNYIKGTMVPGTAYYRLKKGLGEGIFITDNKDIWLKHRKAALERLNPDHFPEYSQIIVQSVNHLIARWEHLSNNNQPIELQKEFIALTLGILIKTIFFDIKFDVEKFTAALQNYGDNFASSAQAIEMAVLEIIAYRKEHPHSEKMDFLDLLLATYDSHPDAKAAEHIIIEELKTFLIAGHETTAASLTWLFYLLSKNPVVEEKLHSEIERVMGAEAFQFDMKDLTNLPFVLATFQESIRLYPPVYEINRVALAQDSFHGLIIPKGAYIKISLYHLHRNKTYWSNPEQFNPERFLNNPYGQDNPGAYLPFGIGPRMCIGRHFASLEVIIIVCMLIQKLHIQFPSDYNMIMLPIVSLTPKDEILVSIKPR
jgi:cytochrome P450